MAESSPRLATKKGANDRAQGRADHGLAPARAGPRPVSPPAVADRMFFTPPRPRRSRGDSMLRRGEGFRLRVEGRSVAGWRWGRGPAVVLLHGWGGHSGQLTSFVPPLLSRGLSAVALDAPGHGRSSRGLSSAVQFARALRAVVEATGPVHGVVAHSLGGPRVALALRDGLPVTRVVLIASPQNPPDWLEPFAARFDIAPHVVELMKRRSERRLGFLWDDLRVPALVAGPRPAAPRRPRPARCRGAVVRRGGDRRGLAGGRLLETAGLGHNRVLRDPEVVAQAVAFVAEGAPLAGCADSLEQNLYDREARSMKWGSGPAPSL